MVQLEFLGLAGRWKNQKDDGQLKGLKKVFEILVLLHHHVFDNVSVLGWIVAGQVALVVDADCETRGAFDQFWDEQVRPSMKSLNHPEFLAMHSKEELQIFPDTIS